MCSALINGAININASEVTNSNQVDDFASISAAVQEIENLENKALNLRSYEILYDIEDNPSYLLLDFDEGYAIISRNYGMISEYEVYNGYKPYDNFDQSAIKYYAGPFNYYSKSELTRAFNLGDSSNVQTIIQLNKEFLSLEREFSNQRVQDQWVGINASYMSKYSSGMWVNSNENYPPSQGYSSDGICGTIASAAMLAYYDDHVNDDYVSSSIRERYSSSPSSLVTTLFHYIDEGKNGTIASDLGAGINNFLSDYSYCTYGHRAGFGLTTTFSHAKEKIEAGYPLVIGLTALLGSTYGNHWVLAYQYYDYSSANGDKYKVVDNHGSYNAVVSVQWSVGYASME